MEVQYVIVGIVVAGAIVCAVRFVYKEIKENIQYRNYGCAGCAFYDRCKRNKKKTR